jgi:predicted RNA polymerase sigma factor
MKLGRAAEARAEFERASELTANARERELSEQRARTAGAEQRARIINGQPAGPSTPTS